MPEDFMYLFISFEYLDIQFFNSLACDLQDTMPRQGSLQLSPREVDNFPRGGNHSKYMPLATYLDCNQFSIILGLYLYMSILQKFYLW